jgi:DNA repair photolyase
MEVREVHAQRILNPTSIDLGEFVINPYKGCDGGCLYCYARFMKVAQKDSRQWGAYVDVRVNAPDLLEKELLEKPPKRVLLGSTTECFQQAERKYRLTYKILEILNKNRVRYSILTRSPLILDCLPLLQEGYCEGVYFTIIDYREGLKVLLEPKSASFSVRCQVIERLARDKVPVIPYVSPVLPFIFDAPGLCAAIPETGRIEFEGLNFNLGNIDEVIKAVAAVYPDLKEQYMKMRADVTMYDEVWKSIAEGLVGEARKRGKSFRVHVHRLNAYFENKYRGK